MQVIWSDKCYIYIGDNRGTVWVTLAVDEEFNENCVILTFKQSSLRVMIWACIMKGRARWWCWNILEAGVEG